MDPTPEQLKSLDALEQLLDFSGVSHPLRSSVLEALGDPTSVREISFVSPGTLEEVLTTLRVPRPVAEGEELSGPSIPVSPIQKGVVRFLLRVARLRAGLPVEGVSHQVTSESGPNVGVVVHPTTRVKLSSLVDSTAEAELVTLEGSEIRRRFSEYKCARGDYPHKDMEPSGEQFSAVAQLLKTGQAPYVDFALFGPYGKRAPKKLTLVSFSYKVETGIWKRVGFPGPSDFNAWWKAWLVLKSTLPLLQSVDSERLEHYGEFIHQLVEMYGPGSWFFIYQADVRFRSEEMGRIRRNVQITYESQTPEENAHSGYVSERPWDWVWGAALGDTGRAFWESEVHHPAVFVLARIKSRSESILDGITVFSGLATAGVGAGETDFTKRPRPKKKSKKERNVETKLKKGTETTKVEWDTTSEVCINLTDL